MMYVPLFEYNVPLFRAECCIEQVGSVEIVSAHGSSEEIASGQASSHETSFMQ